MKNLLQLSSLPELNNNALLILAAILKYFIASKQFKLLQQCHVRPLLIMVLVLHVNLSLHFVTRVKCLIGETSIVLDVVDSVVDYLVGAGHVGTDENVVGGVVAEAHVILVDLRIMKESLWLLML